MPTFLRARTHFEAVVQDGLLRGEGDVTRTMTLNSTHYLMYLNHKIIHTHSLGYWKLDVYTCMILESL